MKIAVPVTDNMVSGPGEGLEIRIYDAGKEIKLLDTYENPALKAASARGIWMLRSAIDRGAAAIILSGAGAPAFIFTISVARKPTPLAGGRNCDMLMY